METSPALRERVQIDGYRRLRTFGATVLVGASMRIVGRMVLVTPIFGQTLELHQTIPRTCLARQTTVFTHWQCGAVRKAVGTNRPLGGNPVNMQCPSSFTDYRYRPPTKDRNHGGSALRHGAAHRPQALECAIQIVVPGS